MLKALPVRVEITLVNYRVSLVDRREKPGEIYRDNYLFLISSYNSYDRKMQILIIENKYIFITNSL